MATIMYMLRFQTCLRHYSFTRNVLNRYSSTISIILEPSQTKENLPVAGETVEYPPIKPKYPHGKWGKISHKRAWQVYDQGQKIINETTTVKGRLEKLAGNKLDKHPFQCTMKLINIQPRTLDFKQYITKTHTISGLPDRMYSELDVGNAVNILKPLIVDAIEYQADQHDFYDNTIDETQSMREQLGHRLIGHVLNSALAGLSSSNPHLHRCQFDENVRVAAFWKRCGYEKVSSIPKSDAWHDIINFQSSSTVNYQIRTELSLHEVISMDDPICELGEVPDFMYNPQITGQTFNRARPISISGHWVGDPCEFSHLSVIVLDKEYDAIVEERGEKDVEEDSLGWATSAGFTNTVAQAHNQGFFYYADITYPFVNQLLVTDGRWVRFHVYQLNTLCLWKDDEAHPTRNLLWSSPRMPLYDTIENGRVKGLNDDVIKHLAQCLLVEPKDREIDMRPCMSESAPHIEQKIFNNVGEPRYPHYKPGRFEYPRNAVYY